MKALEKFIISAVLLCMILFIIFEVAFALVMIDTNRKKPLPADIVSEKHMSELNIRAVVYSKDNSYYYECPYYLVTNDNSTVNNNYKTWYLMNCSNTGEIIEVMNID